MLKLILYVCMYIIFFVGLTFQDPRDGALWVAIDLGYGENVGDVGVGEAAVKELPHRPYLK